MHTKIKEAIDQDLQIIKKAVQGQNDSDNKFKEIILCLTKTFPFKPGPYDYKSYDKAYNKLEEVVTDIDTELDSAMYDVNAWLIGRNLGYNNISSELIGDDEPHKVYDYLINITES